MKDNSDLSKSLTTGRRQFLKGAAAWAGIQIVPSHILGGPLAPSNTLTKGIIGCGMIFSNHIKTPGKLIAICDVDQKHLAKRMQTVKGKENGVTPYHDYKELINRDDLDIVHIATPPHWHALMTVEAAKAGKDIWCEKPMSRTIAEGQLMIDAVQKYERIFRLNTWFRFRSNFYGLKQPVSLVKKAVDNQVLGEGPYKVTISKSTGFDWKFMWVGKTNLPTQPVPDHFDYETWLGPAPAKPYNKHRTHATFRGYWDYDGGGLGDMGQHYLDPVQYILGKDDELPISVEIDADPQDSDAIGEWRRIEYTYADGTKIILDGEDKDKDAAFIEGPKGKIMKGFKSDIPNLIEKLKGLPEPAPQETDFHECVRERKKFCLNEQNGYYSSTLVNFGIIAHRINQNLDFNPETFRFAQEEANALIDQPARDKYQINI
ncbi:Gfo/Idh/MocA family oxidoreductase [Persicirhabdus sediminis]|uniref:Gfo/Idh/MocA family oxidoreductase n=1 Tax=Persicirhabdus sediminis TaxID=454144 RepID=A0A8J7SKZ4_9BACT|nr:Gfo/Idh/MocA family oxidoreductase [Persicirhabdus sediminis]MBK1792434.1 Gfo/Idh/MocA family oxidoreductase [Persicirhabdus sediminis]